eukprot:Skav230435  [mRNA]  locus=scaffold1601:187641:190073:- [translate_table: standard]
MATLQAVLRLEEDLQKRRPDWTGWRNQTPGLTELRSHELELEKSLRSEQKRKNDLDEEVPPGLVPPGLVDYWRLCGQALLKRAGAGDRKDQALKQQDLQAEMKVPSAACPVARGACKDWS